MGSLDRARVKLGLEMIPTVLPIHDPADLEQMQDILHGIPWGRVAYALAADIFNAADRHPEGWDVFNDYLEFLVQAVAFMRGERSTFPDAINDDDEIRQLFENRMLVIEKAFAKKKKKAEAKK